jgi:hypothetical protein
MNVYLKPTGISTILLWVLMGLLIFVISTSMVLTFYPYDPFRLDSISADKKVICRGQEICFTVIGEKFYDIPAYVTVDLINGETISIMNYRVHMPPGPVNRKRCFIIPYNVKPGNYRINWTAVYPVNVFKPVTRNGQSGWIEVK